MYGVIIFIPIFSVKILGELFEVPLFELFNNEGFKVHIFNIFIGILSLFLLKKDILINKRTEKVIYILLGSLLIGSVSSLSISNSLFPLYGEKSHNLILFSNLILFGILILNIFQKRDFIKIKKVIFLSIFGIALIGFLGYFITFGESERLISTFNHHNFLAPILLIGLFLSFEKLLKTKVNIIIGSLIFLALILTKSYLGIFLGIVLILFKTLGRKIFLFLLSLLLLGGSVVLYSDIGKLNSLISRFYIWENSLIVQFQNVKDIIFGMGFENLYDKMHILKVDELYFFENYSFIPDRSHNLIIDLFNYGGVLGIFLLLILAYFLVKNLNRNGKFLLFFTGFFMLFNFPTISYFIFSIPLIGIEIKKITINKSKIFLLKGVSILGLVLSILSIYSTYLITKGDLNNAEKIYPLNSEISYKLGKNNEFEGKTIIYFAYKINKSEEKYDLCESFVEKYPIAEVYAYCGDILYSNNYKSKAIEYYKKTLNLLPKIEEYTDNKKLIKSVNHRLFSERYGISEIKKRIEEY